MHRMTAAEMTRLSKLVDVEPDAKEEEAGASEGAMKAKRRGSIFSIEDRFKLNLKRKI